MPLTSINGARLRQWRNEAHLKQFGLAEKAGCSERAIRNAETQNLMSEQMIAAVCRVLGKPREELIQPAPKIKTAILDGVDEEQDDLYESALQCHRRLFPDAFADISRKYMREWLRESFMRDASGTGWREIYAVAYQEQSGSRNVIGLTSLSARTDWPFWYCTRLGVLPEHRSRWAIERLLFQIVRERADHLHPTATTCVWEVEAPDLVLLNELRGYLAGGQKLKTRPDQNRMASALRSARRFALFSGIHSLIATTSSGLPLSITSPAWREPLNKSNERQMMLMIHPIGGNLSQSHPDVSKTLEYLYRILYGDSFGGVSTSVEIKNYRRYVERLYYQVKPSAAAFRWGPIPDFEDLITQAKSEGLWSEIALTTAEK